LAEAENIIEWDDDKCVCCSVRLLECVSFNIGCNNTGEFNSGDWNSGDRNSGDSNSGNRNSGDGNIGDGNSGNRNSGDWNSGDWNSGDRNSGYSNSGDRNSGYSNSGYSNSGDRNSGDWNIGDGNSGNSNSGDGNSGNSNSGNRNTGNWNSGDWNSTRFSSGYLNTKKQKIVIFDKETDIEREDIEFPEFFRFELIEWVDYTDDEIKEDENRKLIGGYLKEYEYREAWKRSFDKANKEDVERLLRLPNFNYIIFEEISGISRYMIKKKLNK